MSNEPVEAGSAVFNGAPLVQNKHHEMPSVFSPQRLLENARRQKGLPASPAPEICVLDPDGDIVRHLLRKGEATRDLSWACYHTDLYRFSVGEAQLGIIGCAVGGPFAVLVAEQLFVSGCELLVSITSAGQILPVRKPPYFVLIDKALRDEGVSYHYLPPTKYANANAALTDTFCTRLDDSSLRIERGPVWTTDAPFRETESAIAHARTEGILAVEMEAASLYAFAEARQKPVLCFAHVTNQMGGVESDFEKGEADGSVDAVQLLAWVVKVWQEIIRGSDRVITV
ncbi:MAG: nucleoside phosphorylase [Candidatus Hydrogenedentes bacterium]|nr:nucleoside phosphorylase [Candidatus Hydrogenedentota bacterium]